jgi:hypothetical protein
MNYVLIALLAHFVLENIRLRARLRKLNQHIDDYVNEVVGE